MAFRQFDFQIGTAGILIMKLDELLLVEELRRLLQEVDMLAPLSYRVDTFTNAHRLKDGLPKFFHRFFGCIFGEYLRRPALGRHRHHAPGILVAHQAFTVL